MAERTKAWIVDAMRRLMAEKPIEKIRVTDICKEAEISRPTFYYHFKDKYDLAVRTLINNSLMEDIFSAESAVAVLQELRDDFSFYRRAYEVNSQSPFWDYRLNYLVKRYSEKLQEALGAESLDPTMAFSVRLYCHGALGMTREWLLDGSNIPARDMFDMLVESLPQNIGQALYATKDASSREGKPGRP